jgi:hypothetical protein
MEEQVLVDNVEHGVEGVRAISVVVANSILIV